MGFAVLSLGIALIYQRDKKIEALKKITILKQSAWELEDQVNTMSQERIRPDEFQFLEKIAVRYNDTTDGTIVILSTIQLNWEEYLRQKTLSIHGSDSDVEFFERQNNYINKNLNQLLCLGEETIKEVYEFDKMKVKIAGKLFEVKTKNATIYNYQQSFQDELVRKIKFDYQTAQILEIEKEVENQKLTQNNSGFSKLCLVLQELK